MERSEYILMSGDEAVALGAMEADVRVVAGYPGTPSSEILETIAEKTRGLGVHVEWSTNEKVAYEVAFASALAGVRSLCTTKHLGMNVLSDTLLVSAYTGVNAGLVIVTADDIHPFSSQNAEDTRYYARLARLPMLEPSSVSEARELTIEAFSISERLGLPVILRITDRIAHGKGGVKVGQVQSIEQHASFVKNDRRYVMVASNSRVRTAWLRGRMMEAEKISEAFKWNVVETVLGAKLGVVTSGVAYEHVVEALNVLGLRNSVSVLKLAFTNPLPVDMVTNFLRAHPTVLVIEEIEPIMETEVSAMAHRAGLATVVLGRLDDVVPHEQELTPGRVGESIVASLRRVGVEVPLKKLNGAPDLPRRVPNLCAGCPHAASYYALKQAKTRLGSRGVVCGDRGCYNQGSNEPLCALDTCIAMGASIGMAAGFRQAGLPGPVVAVIGDSTFLHAGIPALINAVHNHAAVTVMILDNGWTAMTGHQPNPTSGVNVMGNEAPRVVIEEVARACGVKQVSTVTPYNVGATTEAIVRAVESGEPAVIVCRQQCPVQEARLQRRAGVTIETRRFVVGDTCTRCGQCLKQLGCPALEPSADKMNINKLVCVGCGVYSQVCPAGCIQEAVK